MIDSLSDDEYNLMYSELVLDEGKRLTVYLDTEKIPTVAIGCNLKVHDTTPIIGRKLTTVGQTISESECNKLFRFTLNKVAIIPLYKNIPDIMDSLDSVRQRALINLCFNMGWGTFSDFKNTLKFIKKHDFVNAAENLKNSKWYTQVGNRGPRIVYMVKHGKPHPDYNESN